ncbi:MAG: acyl-CoA dehydrogenase family protein [Hyphomicrobiales bacterium]|nr:acyl-CoA dehydrogenase family protein [Hyphomicrobiales bacterium]
MFQLEKSQQELRLRARAFAQAELPDRAMEIDATQEYPWDIVEKLTKAGFVGMTIPEEYGGQGLGYLETVLVIEEMAKACGVTARIAVETNMGAISAIMAYGSQDQKKLAAGLVLDGDKPAICMTEPDAGSALTELATRADKRGDQYILNGKKHWITGGGVSHLHLIFARVFEDGEDQGIAAFIALRDKDEGFVVGDREPTMGLRGIPETEIEFRDLTLDASRMVVPPEGIRRGFAGLMNAYNGQRTGAATVALGIATGAYDLALQYAKERRQFGRPIAEFQGLQWMLADMATSLDAARLLIHRAAASAPEGEFPDPLFAAQAKIYASETAISVTNNALQIHGAPGYSRNLPLERMVRDARMFTIGGGTAQLLRNLVAARILDRKFPQRRDGYENWSDDPLAADQARSRG